MGMIIKILVNVSVHIHIKCDNSRSDSFGDYVSNKNQDRPWTDRPTDTGDIFRTLGVMKRRKNMKVAIRPTDSITILPNLRSEVKMNTKL